MNVYEYNMALLILTYLQEIDMIEQATEVEQKWKELIAC